MLLVHQTGSVRVGEVVRYTLTYTPSHDRILPSPAQLHVKIKNSSAIALRAAYLHGPYTLYAACYPSTFNPNIKHERPDRHGVPQFESNLKAGGSWTAQLTVPENIRETAGKANVRRTVSGGVPSSTWIIEISSQVIFSTSAVVHFELLIGRDEKSMELGLNALTGSIKITPGRLQDHQQGKRDKDGHGAAQAKGVYSGAIGLVVDDTASLWNKPALPEWADEVKKRGQNRESSNQKEKQSQAQDDRGHKDAEEHLASTSGRSRGKKRKNIHLVILTHGLHSNTGSDMLYLKESIDSAAKQARLDSRKWRQPPSPHNPNHHPDTTKAKSDNTTFIAPLSGGQEDLPRKDYDHDDGSDDEEEVIVRGFSGNVIRTERGIQYLGKRLAKYVLYMTYPNQPYLPVKKSMAKSLSRALTGQERPDLHAKMPSHQNSSVHKESATSADLAYQITSISFIGHSLGGLTQTYAIAYIHKHSPHFFEMIKPINFVALASPFLGLSNENPIYVKFALDFGLVGRTGQDLGLTWRAPTVVRSGWGAMIAGIGTEGQRAHRQVDPGAKPLLRILPTGPAHQVLKMFKNRTVYSNVVNDGIVPLRTSCLLFLDWRGLGRVEKARRENGLVGTMAGWGWAELTGANSSSHRTIRGGIDRESNLQVENSGDEGSNTPTRQGDGDMVPQPAENATRNDTTAEGQEDPTSNRLMKADQKKFEDEDYDANVSKETSPAQPSHPLSALLSFLRPSSAGKSDLHLAKNTKIYRRSQTVKGEQSEDSGELSEAPGKSLTSSARPRVTRGDSVFEDPENVFAPPKTTFFESAGHILNPPLPTEEYLTDPSSRPRTIFHDRIYHPNDIPSPPPLKRRSSFMRSLSGDGKNNVSGAETTYERSEDQRTDGMKVEEKIARAYHRDLSWRKVLVRLEPDAHNNIVVRRMFSNAYGWPVVKHLVDTHFAYTYSATTADQQEPSEERAKPMDEKVDSHGEELMEKWQTETKPSNTIELRESEDHVEELKTPTNSMLSNHSRRPLAVREESATWDDRFFEDNTEDEDDDINPPNGLRHIQHAEDDLVRDARMPTGTCYTENADFLSKSPVKTSDSAQTESPDREWVQKTHSIITPALSTSPSSTTTTGVGLGKSVEEQMSPKKQALDQTERPYK